jgi:hypothetical protein
VKVSSAVCPLPIVIEPQDTPLTSTIARPITILPERIVRVRVSDPVALRLENVDEDPKAISDP